MSREKAKFHRSRHPTTIDGFIPSGRYIGPRRVLHNRQSEAESMVLGGPAPAADGFQAENLDLGRITETYERRRLADEPIIIGDDGPAAPANKTKKRTSAKRRIIRYGLLSVAGLLAAIFIFLGWKFDRSASKIFHGSIFGIFSSTKLKGEDSGRVNILVAGNSADDPGHDGANLTDSIMLISLDTQHNTGYILSIPRDLWVSMGVNNCYVGNNAKINAVYVCGQNQKFQQAGFPSGGMGLLEKQVDHYFGINVDYYALIDYSALRDAVNAVGGIPFTVNSPDSCGLYDGNIDWSTRQPLVKLSNGTHTLTGQQALDIARARGDPPYPSCGFELGDFTRTQNQRQMFLNLKQKALSAGVLTNPARISSLLDAMGNNIQTDFQTKEMRRLAQLSKLINNDNMKSVGLSDHGVDLVRTGDVNGQSVVMPVAGLTNFSAIQAYIRRLNSNDPVAKEDATAVILNGSGVSGMASGYQNTLSAKGITVQSIGNAAPHPHTVVVMLNPNKPATKAYLQQLFNVSATSDTTANPEAKYYSADFVIIMGKDAAPAPSSPTQTN